MPRRRRRGRGARPLNVQSLHLLNQPFEAHALYKRDVHYMVSPHGKVLIIDEFTGRVLAGRRWATACTKRSRPKRT